MYVFAILISEGGGGGGGAGGTMMSSENQPMEILRPDFGRRILEEQ